MDRFGTSQQPAWISASTEEMADRERAFFRSVYGWMFAGLLLTAAAAVAVSLSPAFQQLVLGSALRFVLFAVELGLVFFLSARITRMSTTTAMIAFVAFALLNGVTLSAILLFYARASIVNAFLGAAAMFGGMAIYGTVTKRDLTSWGSFFFMGLIGVLLLSVINIFLHSSAITFTVGVVGIFVFLGLTAWDHQRLKAWAHAGGGMSQNLAIIGALSLYLNFINIFLYLLQLFGGRRR
jgi:FtsH-binding integral membrane protein